MRANTRLVLSLAIVVFSGVYGLLVAYDPSFAETVALGYVGLLLTIIAVINIWKSP